MNKQDFINRLVSIIERHGFRPAFYAGDDLPSVDQSNDAYCGISLFYNTVYDENDRRIAVKVIAQARVCRMNSNATTDELRSAADQIRQGADMADEINGLDLSYELCSGKEDS